MMRPACPPATARLLVHASLAAAVAAVSAACDEPRPAWDRSGAPPAAPRAATAPAAVPALTAVAAVNGVALTQADLDAAMAAAARGGNPHGGEPGAGTPSRAEVLDDLIDQELAAQRARARGFDADPELQQEVARRQAQLDLFRRQRLAVLLQRDIRTGATASDADVRRFFDEHAEEIRTEVRVFQILVRDRATIEQARRDLDAGTPFEEVAARNFPHLPAGTTPWDLGYLTWHQIPEAWAPALKGLAVGATSPIIDGPKGRFWLIKVVDRRVDPTVSFEAARPMIAQLLQARAAEAALADLTRDLRAGARIECAPAP